MAGKNRPSFLKRQKEQQRTARALEKREARRLNKRARTTEVEDGGEPEAAVEPVEGAPETETSS
jgi:hypothetical protein